MVQAYHAPALTGREAKPAWRNHSVILIGISSLVSCAAQGPAAFGSKWMGALASGPYRRMMFIGSVARYRGLRQTLV